MSAEIKEILDRLLKYFKESNINDFGYEQDKLISYEEAQILLDYITNLEDRIDKAIEYIESKVISNGEVIDQLRKIEVKELLEILKGEDKE